ncbi:MAG TPA: DUF1800 family protein, partial [Gammaproteobacteria bacterium]|nr:DUF1800 family protein [Gammaproteobacteria bacterium]
FLSHVRNTKGNPSIQRFPDENYAREMMQLFSIGIFELSSDGKIKKDAQNRPIEAYDNDTVKTFARVFTGLNYARNATFSSSTRNLHEPMVMFEDQHDAEAKILLQGQVLPAGQTGMQDIQDTLDNVFNHPNVPPFIARMLIQRLVTSNPSRFYIRRVAKAFINNGHGVRGDFKAVIKAILLDREAINTQHYAMSLNPLTLTTAQRKTEYTRLREPVLRYSAFYRAFDAKSNYPTKRFMIPNLNRTIGQAVYSAPSVFGFYSPDFQPPGDIPSYKPSRLIPNGQIYAPEFQIMTPVADFSFLRLISQYTRNEFARFTLPNATDNEVRFDFSDEIALAERPSELLAHLDLLLCHGGLSNGSKDIITKIISSEDTFNAELRAKMAIYSVMSSSDCAIE